MAQPIFDPVTGDIIGFQDASTMGSPWEVMPSAMGPGQAAAINQPPQMQVEPSQFGPALMTAPTPPSKEERKLIDEMNRMQMERIARQSAMVDESQQRLNLLREQPAQLDISPLLGLADAWTGSNLAQGYKKPESPLQRQERLLMAEDRVASQRDKVTDDQQRLLESSLRERLGMMRAKSQDAALRSRLQQMNQGQRVPANLASELGGANASVQALDDAATLIGQNQDIAGPAAGRVSSALGYLQIGERGRKAATLNAELKSRAQIIGKYLEGGKLTDADIDRYVQQLPGIADDPQVAAAKVKNLQRLIAAKQQAELAGLQQAGYNTAGIQGSAVPGLRKAAGGPPKRDYNSMSDAELEALLGGN